MQSFSISHFPSLMLAMAKPIYLAICEHSASRPVIVFVPSRRQCASTASDLLTYCIAEDREDRFLHISNEELEPHLSHISDQTLMSFVNHGIGYYHEALSRQDMKIVERLFEAGAIQVLITSRVGLCIAYIVVLP
jgi:pre-mRNA-splicing helicase BRR2